MPQTRTPIDPADCPGIAEAQSRLLDLAARSSDANWDHLFDSIENVLAPLLGYEALVPLVIPPEPDAAAAQRRRRLYTRPQPDSPFEEARHVMSLRAPFRDIAATAVPAWLPDYQAIGEGAEHPLAQALVYRDARSLFVLPVGFGPTHDPSRDVACLLVFYHREPHVQGPNQRAAATHIAPLLLALLRNVALYQQRRHRSAHAQIIQEVSAEVLSQAPSVDQLYRRVVDRIHDRFEFYGVAMFDAHWGAENLHLVAHAGDYEPYEPLSYRQSMHVGILGHVAHTGRPYLTNDAPSDPHFHDAFPDAPPVNSVLAVPVKLDDGFVAAVLEIQNLSPGAFDRYAVESLEVLCGLIGRMAQSTERYEQTHMLHSLGQELQRTLDLDSLLHAVLTCVTAGPGFGFNNGSVFLLDDDETALRQHLQVGPASGEDAYAIWSRIGVRTLEEYLREATQQRAPELDAVHVANRYVRVPVTPDLLAEACAWDGPFIIRADEPSDNPMLNAFAQLSDASECLVIPLVARDELVGVVVADNMVTGQPITPRQFQSLGAFASQAALAMSNAAAYRKLEAAFADLKDAQAKLLENEKLAIMGQMAAHVAHEIRNPLVNIGGFAGRIVKTSNDDGTTRRAEIIVREASRLEIILKDVMDFASPLSFDFTPERLPAMVDEMMEVLGETAQDAGVTIVTEVASDLPAIDADAERIKQVVLNLAKNSIEAMPDGGTLTLRLWADADHVGLDIEDTGKGIAEDDLERLFEPFFTTKRHGSGLGLAVTKRIVEQHGGSITAHSELHRGTTFRIRLPQHFTPEDTP
jgi:signal transduction histidine kinase/putative methionine-R-sulfoxide reductase with GAF domain